MKGKISVIKEFILGNSRPFKACHASTVIEARNGDFFVAWFGGSKEGENDVAIWGSKRNGNSWTEPRMLAKVNNQPHWNPVLFRGNGSEIFLYFKVGKNCKSWKTWVTASTDEGESWSVPVKLIPGNMVGRGPVKNKCLELSDGAWLAPASSEIGWWQAFVDRSEDMGKSWERSGFVPMDKKHICMGGSGVKIPFHVIQPSLWESAPGKVHMLLRSSSGKICRSDSHDGGRTWGKIYETTLPNNNSGIDIAKFANGELLLAFNPVSENWGPRWPLSLTFSKDNGESWESTLELETEPGREYSYPAIIPTSDGGAAITYTWGRENIVFSKLTKQDISNSFRSRKQDYSRSRIDYEKQPRFETL